MDAGEIGIGSDRRIIHPDDPGYTLAGTYPGGASGGMGRASGGSGKQRKTTKI